jgi:hypothetical protein
MAYMNQEKKAKIAPQVKAVLKKYRMKGTLSVRNHSTLVLSIKEGSLDMIGDYNETVKNAPGGFRGGNPAENYLDLNPYWYQDHFSGKCLAFVQELFDAMNDGNHDRSDIQSDYFDVGWYVDVNVGGWNKPYQVV